MVFRLQAETVKINKVRDYLYLFMNVKMFIGILFQVIRNGSYPIALVNGKSNHRFICCIFAHEGNIRTMQGGHKRDINAVSRQDLLGHKCGRGMGNSVMNMKEVKLFKTNNVYQLTR
ncbi:hypothetical protein D9M68_608050 [compost metagenome]